MPSCFFEAVDAGDVRMVQRREHFGFALKASKPIVVSRERGRQNLNGDLAFELRVRRAVDLAHPAGAYGGDHFIGAETGTGNEGQRWRDYTGQTDRERDLTITPLWRSIRVCAIPRHYGNCG